MFNRCRQRANEDMRLLRDNQDAVRRQNHQSMIQILQIVGAMALCFSLWFILKRQLYMVGFGYAFLFAVCLILYLCRKRNVFSAHPLAVLYAEYAVCMGFAIFLSIFTAPEQKATVLLGFLCITPLIVIDRPWRVDALLAGALLLHTILAFLLKPPSIAGIDTVNSWGFYILGINLGNASIRSRLNEIDLCRRSEVEKRVDILSGISNRRCLFERLTEFEKGAAAAPSGVLLFDIDDFKHFNDQFGHAAGDECLRKLGKLLLKLEQEAGFSFYRYGGDEFAGFVYAGVRAEFLRLAEELKTCVGSLAVNGCALTISIGAVYCGSAPVFNYEKVLDCADRLLYAAKAKGRNTICLTDYDSQAGGAAARVNGEA